MWNVDDLERELRMWREQRGRKPGAARPPATDRRTVRVNGQEVVVVKKPKRTLSLG